MPKKMRCKYYAIGDLLQATEKKLRIVCILLFVIVSIGNTLLDERGGNALGLFFIFMLVAYLKKYKSRFIEQHCVKIFLISAGLIFAGCVLLNLFQTYTDISWIKDKLMMRVFVCWNPVVVTAGISLFWVFNTKSTSNKVKLLTHWEVRQPVFTCFTKITILVHIRHNIRLQQRFV